MKELEAILTKWGQEFILFLPKIAVGILVLLVSFYLARVAKKYLFSLYSTFEKTRTVANFIASTIYYAILLTGTFITLEFIGLESVLAKLLAGAGIVGIVAGFALKDIASNAFSGMILHFQQPFRIHDWVDINGNFGTISSIGWITTYIKTVLGQEVFVPNQLIYNNTFTNYSSFRKRRVVLSSGVSYGDDLEKVKTVALDEVAKLNCLLANEPIDFYFTAIGSSSYNFEVRFWISFLQQKHFLEAQSEVIMRIKKRFEQEDISLAYSVLTLDFGVKGGVNIFDKPLLTKAE